MGQGDWGLVVGINGYPKIVDLGGAVKDAKDVIKWILSDTGGNLRPESRLKKVLSNDPVPNPNDNPAPVADQVEDALTAIRDEVLKQINDQGIKGRRLYLYFAGHGFCSPTAADDVGVIMANGDYTDLIKRHIAGKGYANWFKVAAYFDEIVLLMDCCRTSSAQPVTMREILWQPNPDPQAGKVRMFVGYATKLFSQSWESPDAASTQGLFTKALIEGLNHAEPDENGNVTGVAIKKYVYNRVVQLQDGKVKQEPEFPYDDTMDIVWFTKPQTTQPQLEITFDGPPEPTVEVFDPHLTSLGTFPTSSPVTVPGQQGMFLLKWANKESFIEALAINPVMKFVVKGYDNA